MEFRQYYRSKNKLFLCACFKNRLNMFSLLLIGWCADYLAVSNSHYALVNEQTKYPPQRRAKHLYHLAWLEMKHKLNFLKSVPIVTHSCGQVMVSNKPKQNPGNGML